MNMSEMIWSFNAKISVVWGAGERVVELATNFNISALCASVEVNLWSASALLVCKNQIGIAYRCGFLYLSYRRHGSQSDCLPLLFPCTIWKTEQNDFGGIIKFGGDICGDGLILRHPRTLTFVSARIMLD